MNKTKGERRAEKQRKERYGMRLSNRSIFLIMVLSGKPKKKKG